MRYIGVLLFAICYCLEGTVAKSLLLQKPQEIVDLTWPFDNNTIYWVNVHPFEFTKKIGEVHKDGYWYAGNEFCAGEHGGTHFDAPYHFNKDGWKVGDVPLTNLVAQGIVVDLTEEVANLHDQAQLLPEHLDEWERKNGPLPSKCVILVRFGWSQYYSNRTVYLGLDDEGNVNFPGISSAAAEWIAESGKVVGVGLDTASVDPGREKNFIAHRTLAAGQIYGMENVNIPLDLPERGFQLYVMPMKIQEGTGAPLRVIAESPVTGTV